MTRPVVTATALLAALIVAAPDARAEGPVLHREALPAEPTQEIARPWSVMLSGGLATDTHLNAFQHIGVNGGSYPRAWQLEVVKLLPDHWMWGFGLDDATYIGPGTGVFVLGGAERRLGRLRAEVTAGLGMERAMVAIERTVWTYTSGLPTSQTPMVSTSVEQQYVPYARVFGTLAFELTPVLDVVARLGGHLMVAASPQPAFLESGLGVRYRLP
jgi:hypothetical protein